MRQGHPLERCGGRALSGPNWPRNLLASAGASVWCLSRNGFKFPGDLQGDIWEVLPGSAQEARWSLPTIFSHLDQCFTVRRPDRRHCLDPAVLGVSWTHQVVLGNHVDLETGFASCGLTSRSRGHRGWTYTGTHRVFFGDNWTGLSFLQSPRSPHSRTSVS